MSLPWSLPTTRSRSPASGRNVLSRYIDQWTLSERAVAVEISERGGAPATDVDAVEWVLAFSPFLELWLRRRPRVLKVFEPSILAAHDKIQVACERGKSRVARYTPQKDAASAHRRHRYRRARGRCARRRRCPRRARSQLPPGADACCPSRRTGFEAGSTGSRRRSVRTRRATVSARR